MVNNKIVSDESSPETSSKHNSATEISTDSEFAVDEPTPTREIPSIVFNDFNVTKRGCYGPPKKVQVKSSVLQSPVNGKAQKRGIQLEFTPLVPSPVLPKPAPTSLLARTEGYALNRTQSTSGIATKVSLELKKKYLLGDSAVPGSIQKSGSVSTLDSKFKSFHTNISDCQKLLKPASEISPSMQVFCNKLNERRSPLSPIISQSSPFADKSPVKSLDAAVNKPITPSSQSDFKYAKEEKLQYENRPRSPVKKIPFVVPKIDWNQSSKAQESDISSDSLTSDSDSDKCIGLQKSPTVKIFSDIPRVEIHNDVGEILKNSSDEIALDSLCPIPKPDEVQAALLKSIPGEKKTLNQPKTLPGLHSPKFTSPESEYKYVAESSGQSTPSERDSIVEHTTAALTETELSDWARDSAVSDDFEDVEFELNPDLVNSRKSKQSKYVQKLSRSNSNAKTNTDDYEEVGHICGKEKQMKDFKNKISLSENLSNILSSIEFMDTGEETSSDEKALVEATSKNNGYVEFQNEDDMVEDSLNPNINEIIETVNPEITENLGLNNLSNQQKNTGYCVISNEKVQFGGEVIDLKEADVDRLKEKQSHCENEEDSLLIIETGTTTSENTCSESTVKNLIEKFSEKEQKDILNATSLINENKTLLNKIRSEQKEQEASNKQEQETHDIKEYQEHCQRLQSKVEFGNVRDSIDIRKSKRKDKSELPPKPDLIQEEIPSPVSAKQDIATPKLIYTKEEIKKMRDENQRLVQEMVMNKMKAQNRTLERKRRSRNSLSPSLSPSRPFELGKSATTDIAAHINRENAEKRNSAYSISSNVYSTPDVLLSTHSSPVPLEKSHTIAEMRELHQESNTVTPIHPKIFNKQLSIHASFKSNSTTHGNPESFSLPDIHQALKGFETPKAPPRQKSEDVKKTTEKLKHDARLKAQMKSNEDLGLSPEEKLMKLRQKISKKGKENENVDIHIQDSIESLVINTERRNSLLYSNDTLKKKRNNSFKRSKSGDDTINSRNASANLDLGKLSVAKQTRYPVRTKSVSEIPKAFADAKLLEVDVNVSSDEVKKKLQFCKSDPNLLTESSGTRDKKLKVKDRERRKSITKFIAEFFGKKREGVKGSGSSTPKSFLSRISPKSKSKSMINLTRKNAGKLAEKISRTNSFSEDLSRRRCENVSPPPIPPLPLHYSGFKAIHCTDDSSDGEGDWKHQERSSCDTLDQSGVQDCRHASRSARKAIRQAHLKRHRMAQEIQRKLEETEVKTRELEQQGVWVEKALRGETNDASGTREESELLMEWFDLMRDLTELRRYERELMVRAQELELEDRHARLQQELRERLDNEDHKTKEDVKLESSIISEMMEIVAKRDSLIALLEQDRLRYSEEDRDFEEQMLAKGLQLTPVQKTPTK